MSDINEPLDPNLEAELRRALGAVADALPVGDADVLPIDLRLKPSTPARRWQPFAAAAAVVLVVGFGAFMLGRGGSSETISTDVAAPSDDVADDSVASGLDGTYYLAPDAPDNQHLPIVRGSEPTLTIDGDQWGGTAACNGYGGTVTVDPDGNMVIGDVSWTEMGCEPALMESEQAFLAALLSMTHVQVIGDKLMLNGAESELLMLRVGNAAPGTEVTTITDTNWRLDTIIEGDTAKTSPEIQQSTARFETDGTFRATGPCLVLTGEYTYNGLELQAGSMSAGYPDVCGGDPGPDDQVILPHFESSRVDLTNGRLTLTEGANSLIYVIDDQTDVATPVLNVDGSYLLTNGILAATEIPLVAGGAPTLEIAGTLWAGNASCNGYGGTFEMEGPSIVMKDFTVTATKCDDVIIAIETSYLEALNQSVYAEFDAERHLILTGGGTRLEFTRMESESPPEELRSEEQALLDQLPLGETFKWPPAINMVVFMQLGAPENEIDYVAGLLDGDSAVVTSQFFNQEQAFQEFVLLFNELQVYDASVLQSIQGSSLPASFRIELRDARSSEASSLFDLLLTTPGVQEVIRGSLDGNYQLFDFRIDNEDVTEPSTQLPVLEIFSSSWVISTECGTSRAVLSVKRDVTQPDHGAASESTWTTESVPCSPSAQAFEDKLLESLGSITSVSPADGDLSLEGESVSLYFRQLD